MVKTFEGWEASGLHYDKYAQPGDIVDGATVDYFRDTVPPHICLKDFLQYGEMIGTAKDKAGRYRGTWITFYEKEGVWRYAGLCFSGHITHQGRSCLQDVCD